MNEVEKLIDEMLAAHSRFVQEWRDGVPQIAEEKQRDAARAKLMAIIEQNADAATILVAVEKACNESKTLGDTTASMEDALSIIRYAAGLTGWGTITNNLRKNHEKFDRLREQIYDDLQNHIYDVGRLFEKIEQDFQLVRKPDWKFENIATAPENNRVLIFGQMPDGTDEMAMAWKDRIDGRWYHAPQGGFVPFTPTSWCWVPEP